MGVCGVLLLREFNRNRTSSHVAFCNLPKVELMLSCFYYDRLRPFTFPRQRVQQAIHKDTPCSTRGREIVEISQKFEFR